MELVLVGDKPLATAAHLSFDWGTNALVIDATRLLFACPLDLAGLVATAHWASSVSMAVTLRLPTDSNTASYLQRMDVLQLMPSRTRVIGRVPPDARTDLRSRLLEVTPLSPANVDSVAEKLGRLITAFYADYSEAAGHVIYRACGELLANATEHGVSATGAFVAAQTYTGGTTEGPRMEFAICDTGIGVLNHLRQNAAYNYLTRDEVALSKAIKAGVSGIGADRGNGLSDLIDDTRHHGQLQFEMRSGRGEIKVVGSPASSSKTSNDRPDQTPGTWAWLAHWIPVRE